MSEVVIRAVSPGEVCAAELLLDAELGGRHQVRLGEVHDVLALAGCGGWDSDRLVGIATYALVGDRAAVAALAATADRQRGGIGGRLVEVVASAPARKGADELWLVTTQRQPRRASPLSAPRLPALRGPRRYARPVGRVRAMLTIAAATATTVRPAEADDHQW